MAARASGARVVHLRPRASSEGADPERVAELAHEMDTSHLQCRTVGHHWASWTVQRVKERGLPEYFEVTLRCRNCHSTKRSALSARGVRERATIKYADGYLAKGVGRIVGEGKDALWVEAVSRFEGKPARRGRR